MAVKFSGGGRSAATAADTSEAPGVSDSDVEAPEEGRPTGWWSRRKALADARKKAATENAPVIIGKDGKPRKPRPTVWEQTGGAVGLFVSSFPVTVFSLVQTRYGLKPGIAAAIGTAILFGVIRLIMRVTIRPAVSALIGICISSSVAYSMGTAKAYFLFDIWFYLVCLSITLFTLAIRRPLAGLLWASMNRSGGLWRKDKKSLHGYDLATVAWALVFGSRFVVQHWLYDRDLTGWLAFAKVMMGFPLTVCAFAMVIWAVRRSEKQLRILDAEELAREAAAQGEEPDGAEGAAETGEAGEAEAPEKADDGRLEPSATSGS